MKCKRVTCSRKAGHNGRNQGLCEAHYGALPTRGYTDSARASRHLKALNAAGFSWRQLAALTGMTEQGLYLARDGVRVRVATEQKILGVPLPAPFSGRGLVDAVGLQRRIRALQALGWTQRELERRMDLHPRRLSTVLRRPQVYTPIARAISRVYDELSMTLGPSQKTRAIARNQGWPPPLAWNDDEIDDPSATPNHAVHVATTADERIEELRDLGVFNVDQIAERLGRRPKSVERQILRAKQRLAA